MTAVSRDGADFVVEAPLLAETFGLTEAGVRAAMRAGDLTSRCETGEGEDAGRWRLTFHHRDRALRLVVDAAGTIHKRTTFPIRMRGQAGPAGRDPG